MLQPAPAEQDFFWDDLLEYIGEGRVIPIIGAELLTVPDGLGGELPLQRVLAQKLGERLRVPVDDCTGDDALNQVVCRYLQRGGRREEIYPRLRSLMKEIAPPVPEPLRQLARIRHFNLFVTTTFDSLLAQAWMRSGTGEQTRRWRWPMPRITMRTCLRTSAARRRRRFFTCWAACRPHRIT